jgi:hypothetical protein
LIELIDDVRLRLLSLLEFFVFKNCIEISDVTDVDVREFDGEIGEDVRTGFDGVVIVEI